MNTPNTMIWTFVLGLLINLISGIKNALFYAAKDIDAVVTCLILGVGLTFIYMINSVELLQNHNHWYLIVLYIISSLSSLAGVTWMGFMFATNNTNNGKYIHFAEAIIMYPWFLSFILSGSDLFTLLCIALTGNALFNMPIQYGATGRLINTVSKTDDPTGKTEGIWIGNDEIKKPRISNGWIITGVGALFLVGFIIYIRLHWFFSIYTIIDHITK